MADDLSSLISSLGGDQSYLAAGLQALGGGGGDSNFADANFAVSDGGGDYALSSSQLPAIIPGMGKPRLAKAAKLLGAAVAYLGAGALQNIAPAIATVLGVDAGSLIMAFLGKKARGGRRRRGITYRQLANARRVNRTIDRMYHSLHKGQHRGGGYHIQPARSKGRK